LEKDDLASHWRHGVARPADGDFEDDEMPEVFNRLRQHQRGVPDNDLSGMARDRVAPDRDASYDAFRLALLDHFDYRWTQPRGHDDVVVWPRANDPLAAGVAQGHHDNEDQ